MAGPTKPAVPFRSSSAHPIGCQPRRWPLTLASSAGLLRVFAGHGWVWPLLLVAATVHGICWAARRYRIHVLVTLVVAAIAAWLVIAWTIFGPFTHFGVPNSVTWSHFTSALSEARRDFSGSLAPVSPTAGFRLLAALGVAVVAFAGDWLTFGRRWVLFGAAPAFAMFVVCCMTGRGGGRPDHPDRGRRARRQPSGPEHVGGRGVEALVRRRPDWRHGLGHTSRGGCGRPGPARGGRGVTLRVGGGRGRRPRLALRPGPGRRWPPDSGESHREPVDQAVDVVEHSGVHGPVKGFVVLAADVA